MSDVAIRMEHVYKKFRKGEVYDSLRDLLPALTGRMFKEGDLNQKDRREFWALQDLSFEVKRGEALGIMGHNGAGKSTALKILSRIMKPTKGHMLVNGRLSALIEVTAGFHLDLTGRENIFLNGTILGMSKREIQSKLDQIISFSGIEEFIDTPVKRYSSGMFARLGFSVAAHVDPDVLIVDEVLSVGDFLFQQRCIERMKEVLRGGATVLFVSHNLKKMVEFCDRCLLLEKGRTITVGPAEKVVSAYLDHSARPRSVENAKGPVSTTKIRVRDERGECISFQPGQRMWVDIEVAARERCSKLSVFFYITDESLTEIFETSTDRLGFGTIDLEEGDIFTCGFEVFLNFGGGTYHPSVLIRRSDIQTTYDTWEPAATIYVESDGRARGVANCFPQLVHPEIRKASNPGLTPVLPGSAVPEGRR